MLKILVIADDLTGTNDTGALLNKAGFDTVSSIYDWMDENVFEGRDALCLNTDSRSLPSETAKELVKTAAARYFAPGMLLCKRIDSTLRGNVGAEIDAVLEVMPEGTKAIVVSAFPRAGRVCLHGEVLVNGVPLTESDAGRDVKTPVKSSDAGTVIGFQTKRPVETIDISDVRGDLAALTSRIRTGRTDILVFDAETDNDIARIASACRNAEVPVVCIDPGALSVAMAAEFFPKTASEKNLLIIGSLSTATRAQIRYFCAHRRVLLCTADTDALISDFEQENARILKEITDKYKDYHDICLITDEKKAAADMDPAVRAGLIAERFTDAASNVLCAIREETGCIYLSGGDIAKQFLTGMKPDGLDIIDEVIPLAVYSKTIDKKNGGLKLLTKGGMIGGETAIMDMITYAENAE